MNNSQDKVDSAAGSTGSQLSDAERAALIKAEKERLAQEEALNDIRAEQQMIEGAVDTDESVRRMERLRNPGGT